VNPGTEFGNCIEIAGDGPDDWPDDNLSCETVTVNPPGPNLAVFKEHNWDGDARIDYSVRFQNLGDEVVSDVWLTDTLPVGTTWDGWWDMDFDWGRLITATQSSDILLWHFIELHPGDQGWLYFGAYLDEPGDPLPEYGNLIQITVPPNDTDPSDNEFIDVAYPRIPVVVEIAPASSSVPISGTAAVDVLISDVVDLYGVSLVINFDPNFVEVEDADPGTSGVQIALGNCPSPDMVTENAVDNGTGVITYSVSSLSPSVPCDGSGVIATITFHGLQVGTSPVQFTDLLLADSNGQPIEAEIFDGSVSVTDAGNIDGIIQLQGRSDHSGVNVCAWETGSPVECALTDASGYYELQVEGGIYTVTADIERYLDSEKIGVFVAAGGTTTLSTVTLLGGDANNDCTVNILDLSFMGARYTLSCGDPGWDENADINNDCTINILDIVLGGSNYLSTCPVIWP
jgi:hypothetical protein